MKTYKTLLITLLILIVLLLAIDIFKKENPTIKKQLRPSVTTSVQTEQQFGIESLYSATVPNFASDDSSIVRLVNGSYDSSKEIQGNNGVIDTQTEIDLDKDATSYALADFNKDGADDIVALFGASGGGSGYFINLALFFNKNGTPEYVSSVLLGDRIKVNSVTVSENNIIVVDMITQGPNEPLCCGTLHKVVRYALIDNRLEEIIRD